MILAEQHIELLKTTGAAFSGGADRFDELMESAYLPDESGSVEGLAEVYGGMGAMVGTI